MIKKEKIRQFEKSLMCILIQHFDYQWDFKALRIKFEEDNFEDEVEIKIIIKGDK